MDELRIMNMIREATATLNDLRMTPRKVRLVADLIKGLSVGAAEAQLKAMTKEAARPVLKLLQSAAANAVAGQHLLPETLTVAHTAVNSGAVLHRYMPRAMGRATPLRKRSSSLMIVLTGEADPAWEARAEAVKAKTAEKEAEAEVKPELPV